MKGYLPPVTLYVNQDSREEALKHSTVIPIRHSVSDDHLYEAIKPVRHPLWFRSGVDSVYFRNAYPLAGTFFSQISTSVENLKWLRYIQDLTPRLLASIDKMEHQDFYGLRNSNSWHAAEHLELFPSLKVLFVADLSHGFGYGARVDLLDGKKEGGGMVLDNF